MMTAMAHNMGFCICEQMEILHENAATAITEEMFPGLWDHLQHTILTKVGKIPFRNTSL